MDQYSIAFGGITFISTGDTPRVDVLNVKRLPLVVADSCEPREAKKVLNRVKQELENKNPVYHGAFDIIHKGVIEGRKHLENGCDLKRLGELMNTQQRQENVIGAATDKLNLLCKVAIENGAFGAKQMGAGGGGCMLAICPDERTQKVVTKAINKAGGKAEIMDIFCYPDRLESCN
jgi:mevalonate kinase